MNKELPDVVVMNLGSIFTFEPRTPRAWVWMEQNLSPPSTFFGGALVVEHRFAWDLKEGMQAAGLVLV